mmetsp:Transcript_37742/g.58916  ORF Transcript_37742/g.58916 Transcript_37742/m.58916 type:complete len:448 (+) Transcript_37742:44-1387(+)
MMCDAFARSILDNTFPALETVKSLDVKAWSESEQMLFLSSLNRVIEANDIDILLHKRICGVLKQLVSEIESTGQDVLNEVYEALAEFQFSNPCTYYQPEKNIAEDMTIARYPVPDMPGSAISIKQNIWHSEVGLRPWAAAYLLTEWLAERPERTAGRRVLEVGAGVGLTGLMAGARPAAARPACLLLTDYLEEVVENLQRNVDRSRAEGALPPGLDVAAGTLDWCRPEASGLRWADWDLIMGADVVYNRESIPPLCRAIRAMLGCRGPGGAAPEVVVCMKIRSPLVYELFLESLRAAGVRPEFLPHPARRFFDYPETADVLRIIRMALLPPAADEYDKEKGSGVCFPITEEDQVLAALPSTAPARARSASSFGASVLVGGGPVSAVAPPAAENAATTGAEGDAGRLAAAQAEARRARAGRHRSASSRSSSVVVQPQGVEEEGGRQQR